MTNRGSRMGIAGAFTSLFMMGVVPPIMYADGIENGWRHTCTRVPAPLADALLHRSAD